MARALTAHLMRKDVPGREALQAAVDEFGFGLKLDDGYAPLETSGYLPCILDGEDAGFDLRFEAAADVPMSFKWGGDPREEAAALIVCAALARGFGAVVRAGQGEPVLSAEQLLAKAKAALE
jgi:hypothetical protein